MLVSDILKNSAIKIGNLADDETTITSSSINSTRMLNELNLIYRDLLFPIITDYFPNEGKRHIYPQSTYTVTGTVDATSTGTTLVATTAIFNNMMEGFTVSNMTDDEEATIDTYTSTTQVTLDTTIGDTWDGDTIYVLGNEFTLAGSATDFKELIEVKIDYTNSGSYTVCEKCEPEYKNQSGEGFTESHPYYYYTTVKESGDVKSAVGFLPFPSQYNGKFQIAYVEKWPTLTTSDTPHLDGAGMSWILINGLTAWALQIQKRFKEAGQYLEKDKYDRVLPLGTNALIKAYKPTSRKGRIFYKSSNVEDAQKLRLI